MNLYNPELEGIIHVLTSAFEREDVKLAVLDEPWLTLNQQTGIHSTGFCYSASEVIYRLMGETQIWKVNKIIDPTHWKNGTHYFLLHRASNQGVDITSSQYEARGIVIPYDLAMGGSFRRVSRKARLLAQMSNLGNL